MTDLATERLGDPHGAPVVVVHGTMDRAAGFRRSARRCSGLDVVIYDRRGYADSRDRGLSPDLAAQVGDLREVVEWLGRSPVTLVGHSFGGLICAHFAIETPSAVRSLGLWEPPMPWLAWYRSAVGERARQLGEQHDGAAAAEAFLRAMVGDRIWDRMPEAMRAERRSEGAALLADLEMCRRPEAQFDPAALTVPTIVGWGTESPERFGRSTALLLEELPNAWGIEVAEASHGVHLSHPQEFAAFMQATAARGEPNPPEPAGSEA